MAGTKFSRRVIARIIAGKLIAEPTRQDHWVRALAAYLVDQKRISEASLIVNDIEHELLLRKGENTKQLAEAIQAKEKEAWGVNSWDGTLRGARDEPTQALLDCLPEWLQDLVNKAETHEQPFARWCDNDIQLARDLYQLHKTAFIPTAKDNLELQVNNLRVLIGDRQFLLHPRCVNTDRHLRSTTWANHKRKDFARRGGEHGDLVATSIYGVRNLDRRNPAPKEIVDRLGQRSLAPPPSLLPNTRLGRKLGKTG